jgi:hypothetical protein
VTPIVTLCAALAFLPALAGAQAAIDFRGVPLGATEAEFAAKLPGFNCRGPAAGAEHLADRLCVAGPGAFREDRMFGGVETKMLFASFVADRLVGVSAAFNPRDFSAVLAALHEKFGKPNSIERPEFQTMGGVKTQNEVVTWKRGNGIVMARRFARAIDESSVQYVDERDLGNAAARGKEAAKKNAKSL